MYRLGAKSLSYAAHVDPQLMAVVSSALLHSTVDWGFTEDQSRTVAQQADKLARGVSTVGPGPAARHMIQPDGYSKAVDCVPWIDGKFQWGDDQWRVVTAQGTVIRPFPIIASSMRLAAIALGVKIRWGAVWDRVLNDLPADVSGLMQEVERYKVRHPGPDFLDGPHFELPR